MIESTRGYMSRWAVRRRRVFALGLIAVAGLCVHLVFFVLTSVPFGAGPTAENPATWLEWSGGGVDATDPVVAEQVVLFDSKPLFVPTRWNTASDLAGIARLRDETELFVPFAAQVASGRAIWSGRSPVDGDASASLRLGAPSEFTGGLFRPLGKAPSTSTILDPRTASLEITAMGGGTAEVLETVLVAGASPIPDEVWTPVVFQVLVDPLGEGGPPLRLNSSGVPDWDQALTRAIPLQPVLKRLAAGYYRIVVGP